MSDNTQQKANFNATEDYLTITALAEDYTFKRTNKGNTSFTIRWSDADKLAIRNELKRMNVVKHIEDAAKSDAAIESPEGKDEYSAEFYGDVTVEVIGKNDSRYEAIKTLFKETNDKRMETPDNDTECSDGLYESDDIDECRAELLQQYNHIVAVEDVKAGDYCVYQEHGFACGNYVKAIGDNSFYVPAVATTYNVEKIKENHDSAYTFYTSNPKDDDNAAMLIKSYKETRPGDICVDAEGNKFLVVNNALESASFVKLDAKCNKEMPYAIDYVLESIDTNFTDYSE